MNGHFEENMTFDNSVGRGWGEQIAELSQLILYLQGRKRKGTKLANIRIWEHCIDEAIDVLDEVVGLKICFCTVCKTKTSQGYELCVKNILKIQHDTSDENSCYTDEDKAKYGLLIAILMFIYMMHRPGSSNYSVSENSLKSFLKEMGIAENSCFGNQTDLNKLFGATYTAEFISQGWLAFTKRTDESGCDTVTYEWGHRAKSVIDPMEILQAYCTMDGSAPHHWGLHYREAHNAVARDS
ncbi:unnamed protein product [Litomosoides sigmodontis]|uniref:MAGE domain-containing protein n=1 Tax=Litomosoides sigmodontis TaxID=42156 RepID=A0A3P6UBY8_LITSI|nr:unnamed protein product [Litomosoides sigmodontis]